jgi:hypothetical protein
MRPVGSKASELVLGVVELLLALDHGEGCWQGIVGASVLRSLEIDLLGTTALAGSGDSSSPLPSRRGGGRSSLGTVLEIEWGGRFLGSGLLEGEIRIQGLKQPIVR